ncbi:MAG: hypothetical protein ACYTEQ_01735 [Planctomycetota bacterium]|jgi:hypothetical protein
MGKLALAELLLRRKELAMKVEGLQYFKNTKELFEVRVKRVNVTDSVDDVTASVPKLTASQVTAEYDHYASRLRRVDALIQRANWETLVAMDDSLMVDYTPPKGDE